jgi:hypothetical protein
VSTQSIPARGRKFAPEEHAHVLRLILAGKKRDEVATSVGCTTKSLRRWYGAAKRVGALPAAKSNGASSVTAKPSVFTCRVRRASFPVERAA